METTGVRDIAKALGWMMVAGLTFILSHGSAVAGLISENLNFAAVNQNLWGSGTATIVDQTINIPDPNIKVDNLSPGSFSVDPASAIAHFFGIDVGSEISPTASFSTGLSASFHANSGSFDVNYPTSVNLTLPNSIQSGQAFTVSASLPGPFVPPIQTSMSPAILAALGGGGYSSPLLVKSVINSGLLTPTAAFSTEFPNAEAKVDLNLSASGGATVGFCIIKCFDKTFTFGSVDLNQQILELNSLTGIQVLDQPVVSFNQTLNLAQGVSVSFSSPTLSLDGTLQSNQPFAALYDQQSTNFLGFAFNVDQLLPLVGAILQSNVGPIGYDLLSVTPSVSLGISQALSFDPTGMFVDLQFSSPVLDSRDNLVKTDVLVPVDGSNVTLTPATVGGGLTNSMRIKPTYLLDSAVHNTTSLTLDGSLQVQALSLDTPSLGPFYEPPPIDLFSLPLANLDNNIWSSDMAITTQTQSLPFASSIIEQFTVKPGIDTGGLPSLDIMSGDTPLAHVNGDMYRVPVGGGSPFSCYQEISPLCDTIFQSSNDVIVDINGVPANLGNIFCVYCMDRPDELYAQSSPFILGLDNNPMLYLSDLTSFPQLVTTDQLLDPSDPNYDVQLAQSQYFQTISTTPPALPSTTVPEPGTLWLIECGLLGLAATRDRYSFKIYKTVLHIS